MANSIVVFLNIVRQNKHCLIREDGDSKNHAILPISRRHGEQIEGGVQQQTMPSLLCLLFYDALSHHACLFLFASIHLEAELPTHEEMHRTKTCQRNEE